MIFSENRLRDLANIDSEISSNEIVKAINSIGFEVEQVIQFNQNQGLKFGKILSVEKNPNSTKLNVCRVQFNDKERTIQTVAQNVEANDFVVAFVPGSKLRDIEIKEKEMGKIISEGMFASLSELGFDSSLLTKEFNENVLTFKNEIDLNLDPIKELNLDDNLIEVSILSNRADAQSYIVFAKELAAYFLNKPKNIFENNSKKSNFDCSIKMISSETNNLYGACVKTNKFCLTLENKIELLKSSIKLSENEFENFANLNLIYSGVSLRVFDLNKIDSEIKIEKQDKLTVLKSKSSIISNLGVDEIDEFKATNNSNETLFEFSQLDQKIVRDNAKQLKKSTLSSINNSRFISYGSIEFCYEFICKYFSNVSELINAQSLKNELIDFDYEYIKKYAGSDIKESILYQNALNSLNILGFKINDKKIEIPTYRYDVFNMQSIVEEIFRFYGLNNFELKVPKLIPSIIDSSFDIERIITSLGYTQVWTHTLMNCEKNIFNPFELEKINLKTFVSEEFNSVRNSIALPMMYVYDYNQKRKINKMSIFDLGMISNQKSILIASNEKSFAQIKSDIQKITNQILEVRKINDDIFHPNYNAGLFLSGKMVGWIGKFNPRFFDVDLIFAEVLEEIVYKPKNIFVDYDSNPLKERDLTISISNSYENAIFQSKIKSINGVYSVTLISTFNKNDKTNLTYKILLDSNALKEFEQINWNNLEELF